MDCIRTHIMKTCGRVSAEYIHNCHSRVGRHLKKSGKYLLDAGSGPVQYEEYMEYLDGYQYRVCADISNTALIEARKKLGNNGLYVVSDIANLPFIGNIFDGVMSMHTIHHLPREDHHLAYQELFRLLAPASTAVVVNGWTYSNLFGWLDRSVKLFNRTRRKLARRSGSTQINKANQPVKEKGTFVQKYNAAWLNRSLMAKCQLKSLFGAARASDSCGPSFTRNWQESSCCSGCLILKKNIRAISEKMDNTP